MESFFTEWLDRARRRLEPAEVVVPCRYSIHTYPEHVFVHECFPRALDYCESHRIKGTYYVFGNALSGGMGEHGWVELPDDIVFDGVLQRFYNRARYYELERVKVWYRFTRSAAVWLRQQDLDTYRWDVHLWLPFAEPDKPPLLIDIKKARHFLASAEGERLQARMLLEKSNGHR